MRESGLIIAIDSSNSLRVVDSICEIVDGFKVGLPLLLEKGVEVLGLIRARCAKGMLIADLKMADIGYIMARTAGLVTSFVDAVIAHAFVGWKGALDELAQTLSTHGVKLVLVAFMSHEGSMEVYDRAWPWVRAVIDKARPWGLVAPATRPDKIKLLRQSYPEAVILSPGVGAQGARPGDALCAGADYEIVGRAITGSPEPRRSAEEVLAKQREALERCRPAH